MRAPQVFQAVSWLPPALLLLFLREIDRQEGWSGWAVAAAYGPLVVGFSAFMGLAGIVLWALEWRRGRPAPGLFVAALLAGSPTLWFLGRVLYLEFSRGL